MKRFFAVAAMLALLAALAGGASATVLKKLTLGEIEGYASEVFLGTVQSVRCVEDDGPRNLIFTEVTFASLRSLKGKFLNATVTYRFAGGTVGERTLRVIGVPKFAPGQRCLLFTNADVDKLCPAIGWWQGRYLLRQDPEDPKGVLRVHDSDGRAVYGFEDGRPVLTPAKEPGKPAPKPMLASDFEKHVTQLIAKAEEARKKAAEAAKAAAEGEVSR